MERRVVHLNVAHFMASVEELCDSSLRRRPFVVAPLHRDRVVAFDVSEAAFREGIRKGMRIDRIAREWRGVRILEPRLELYHRAERALCEIASRFSPMVECAGGGHLFIDITGSSLLFGQPADCAARIRQEAGERSGLRPVAGLAANRLVSKIGTRVVKPDGFVVVAPGDERAFLHHQEIDLLPGVGQKLGERMRLLGIREMGELAALSEDDALAFFGRHGRRLVERAGGVDNAPVSPEAAVRAIRGSCEFETDSNDAAEMEARLSRLLEDLGMRLRGENLSARRIELVLHYTDSRSAEASTLLPLPSFYDADFFEAARELLRRSLGRRVRVRKIGVSLSLLQRESGQLDLFAPPERLRRESLQRALDRIRKRYGTKAVMRAASMRPPPGG